MRMIDAPAVRASLSMEDCIEAMVGAMTAVSNADLSMPARMVMPLVDKSAFFIVMPGSLAEPRVYGAKIGSFHPGNPAAGRPAIQGFVALFDHDTGTPLALVDGAAVTALRTGAVSGLATRLLARSDAASLGLFGYGVQAAAHLDAVCAVRGIEEVRVWGRSEAKARAFAETQSARTKVRVTAVHDPREAAACDVICTTTSSSDPILFGEWVRPGAHVNLVGAYSPTTREADSVLIVDGRLYVDSHAAALTEAGDILIPVAEGLVGPDHIIGELGAVLLGRAAGRTAENDITIYKSLGVVAQDIVAAYAAYRRTGQ
jgi:ornithine cyclodeaminase